MKSLAEIIAVAAAGALVWWLAVTAVSTFAPYPATTEIPCKKN